MNRAAHLQKRSERRSQIRRRQLGKPPGVYSVRHVSSTRTAAGRKATSRPLSPFALTVDPVQDLQQHHRRPRRNHLADRPCAASIMTRRGTELESRPTWITDGLIETPNGGRRPETRHCADAAPSDGSDRRTFPVSSAAFEAPFFQQREGTPVRARLPSASIPASSF